MISLDDVRAAACGLDGVAHRTPMLRSRTLDARAGAEVLVKAECFQRSGAFKFRGAYTKLASLGADERARGVVAYSSGNHAGAVALAGRVLGVPVLIVMPDDAPAAKRAAVEEYAAEVVVYDKRRQAREEIASALAEERGLALVPPYDDPLIMAGQGTVGLEIAEATDRLDALVVPIGGGGLAAGCATAVKALHPGCRVVGVEPEAGDDTRRSLAAGDRVRVPLPDTIADGLQAPMPGELTFEVNRRLVDEVATVSDVEIVDAMRFVFDRMKVVSEPSGAVGIAALLAGRLGGTGRGDRVAVVLSGGNVGAERFAALMR